MSGHPPAASALCTQITAASASCAVSWSRLFAARMPAATSGSWKTKSCAATICFGRAARVLRSTHFRHSVRSFCRWGALRGATRWRNTFHLEMVWCRWKTIQTGHRRRQRSSTRSRSQCWVPAAARCAAMFSWHTFQCPRVHWTAFFVVSGAVWAQPCSMGLLCASRAKREKRGTPLHG